MARTRQSPTRSTQAGKRASKDKMQTVNMITPHTDLSKLKGTNIRPFASIINAILRKRKSKEYSGLTNKEKETLTQGISAESLEKIFMDIDKEKAERLYEDFFKGKSKKDDKITALKEFFYAVPSVTSLEIEEKAEGKKKTPEEIEEFVGKHKAEYAADFLRGDSPAILASYNEPRYKDDVMKEFMGYTSKRNRSTLYTKEDRIDAIKRMWESNWTKDAYNTVIYVPNGSYTSYSKRDLAKAADEKGIQTKTKTMKVPTVNDVASKMAAEFSKKLNAEYRPQLDDAKERYKVDKTDSEEEAARKKRGKERVSADVKARKEEEKTHFKEDFEPLKKLSKLLSTHFVKLKGKKRKELEKELAADLKARKEDLKEKKKQLKSEGKEQSEVDRELEEIQIDIDHKVLEVADAPEMKAIDDDLRRKMRALIRRPESRAVFDGIELDEAQEKEMEEAYSKIHYYLESDLINKDVVEEEINQDVIIATRDLQKYELWYELKQYESLSQQEKRAMIPKEEKDFVHVDIPYISANGVRNYKVGMLKEIAKNMDIKVADKKGEEIYNEIVHKMRDEGKEMQKLNTMQQYSVSQIRSHFVDKYGNPVPEENFKKTTLSELKEYAKALEIPYTEKNKTQIIDTIRKKLGADNSCVQKSQRGYNHEVITMEKLDQLPSSELRQLGNKIGAVMTGNVRTDLLKHLLSSHISRVLPRQVKMREEFVKNGTVPDQKEKQALLLTCLVAFDNSLANTKEKDYSKEIAAFSDYFMKGKRFEKKSAAKKKAAAKRKAPATRASRTSSRKREEPERRSPARSSPRRSPLRASPRRSSPARSSPRRSPVRASPARSSPRRSPVRSSPRRSPLRSSEEDAAAAFM